MEKQPRSKSLSIADAIAKLCDSVQVISRRDDLKPSKLKWVHEAVTAIIELSNVTTSNTEKSDTYQQFLRKVFKNADF